MKIKLRYILTLAFTIVAVVPVLVLGSWVARNALKEELDAAWEKHLVLADQTVGQLETYALDVERAFNFFVSLGPRETAGDSTKIIAKRLVEAKTTIPHFYLTSDIEIDALLDLRKQINAAAPRDKEGNPDWRVSVNDLIIKALAMALMRVPDANVTWTEGGMLRHKRADVGVAVSIPGGLITPVVRHADTKRISDISNEMKDLAARARTRKLAPQEYQGGTSAVSNLGMFGIKDFAAVINPPHATILAVGAGIETPVVRNGAVEIRTIMTCTLSTDHRAVDGALGAQLLNAFKDYVEKPASMLA